jgi:hypothetical protein
VKVVRHSGGTFTTTDEIADALVGLDRAVYESDTVGRFEMPVPGRAHDGSWTHVILGQLTVEIAPAEAPTVVPPEVIVSVSTLRRGPVVVMPLAEEFDILGYDWM